jgi:hypothetical protein
MHFDHTHTHLPSSLIPHPPPLSPPHSLTVPRLLLHLLFSHLKFSQWEMCVLVFVRLAQHEDAQVHPFFWKRCFYLWLSKIPRCAQLTYWLCTLAIVSSVVDARWLWFLSVYSWIDKSYSFVFVLVLVLRNLRTDFHTMCTNWNSLSSAQGLLSSFVPTHFPLLIFLLVAN